jgi:hypothetical protein
MSGANVEFMNQILPSLGKGEREAPQQVNPGPSVQPQRMGAESGVSAEIISQARARQKPRRVSHTAHILPEIIDEIAKIAKKADLSKSEVTELLLKKALGW